MNSGEITRGRVHGPPLRYQWKYLGNFSAVRGDEVALRVLQVAGGDAGAPLGGAWG